jgi:hypothetical protein
MAGETTQADATATQEDEFEADFEAGFDGAGVGTTETPKPDTAAQPGTEAATGTQATTQPAAAPTATPAPAAAAKVEVDAAELEALRQRAAAADAAGEQIVGMQKKFDQAFGQIGSLKQAIDKLRTDTPAGEKVQVSEEDFKELRAAYPDIGQMTMDSLNRVLAKVRGTGGADPEAIDRLVSERVQVARNEINGQVTDAVLNGIVPRWRQAVNTPAFDTWLKSQPAEVQALAESDDLGDAATMLRRYRRHIDAPVTSPAPPPNAGNGKPNPRQRALAAAVAQRGDGSPPAAAPATDDDDFASGFKEGKV